MKKKQAEPYHLLLGEISKLDKVGKVDRYEQYFEPTFKNILWNLYLEEESLRRQITKILEKRVRR